MSGASTGPDALLGQMVGGYRLESVLGIGSTGAVYLGVTVAYSAAIADNADARPDETQRQQAAVKILSIPWQLSESQTAEFRLRFRREIETLKQLNHPRILPVFTSGQDPATGHLFMAMPYVERSLADHVMTAGGPLSFEEAVRIITQVADALDYAHSQGVVHRDVKPANILLDPHRNVYLTDFGILRLLDSSHSRVTVTGSVLGTPAYMAPEQVLGESVGPAADRYSLAVVLYELVTGRAPFEGDAVASVMMRQVNDAPAAPRLSRPELPEAAEAAMLIGLAKQPWNRFATSSELARAFTAGLRGEWPHQPTPAPSPFQSAPTLATPPSSPAPMPLPWTPYPETSSVAAPALATGTTTVRARAWTPIFVAVMLVAIGAVIGILVVPHVNSAISRGGSVLPTATTSSRTTPTGPTGSPTLSSQRITALAPAGPLLFQTPTPGACDSHGGQWIPNSFAVQTCSNGALAMSDADCNCPIAVVALATITGHGYSTDFVAQARANVAGSASTAKFGFKFRQQSADDSGQGRGGYSFLVDPNGQWQFNVYDADGTRHILDQRQLPFPVQADDTIDLAVRGATFSFYFNGQLIATETNTTYPNGYLCLAVEPASNVLFRDFAMYAPG